MPPAVRLTLALTTSGLVLAATAGGPWSFWLSSLLWAVPALVAVRCLPLPIGLVVAFVAGAVGRSLAFPAEAAVIAAAALVPALLVDRLAVTWLPRAGNLAWPCALVVTHRFLTQLLPDAAVALAPPPHLDAFAFTAADIGTGGSVLVVGLVAQAVAAMAAVLNRQTRDPYSQKLREDGVRWTAICTLVAGIVFFVVETIRAQFSSPPPPRPFGLAELTLVDSAAVVVVVLAAAAVSVWRKRRP